MDYSIVVVPLSEEDGGGYLGFAPDLNGCMSDGETPSEAMANTESAVKEWLEHQAEIGRVAPEPGCSSKNAAERHKHLLDAFQSLLSYTDDLDGRLDQIESDVHEIRRRLESGSNWDRFVATSSLAMIGNKKSHAALC